jgi:CRISPR/Cas system-associated exonuclease Cas4 (RecB family)
MIYRYFSENISHLATPLNGSKLTMIGFNALSISEKEIFGYLKDSFETKFYWDADEYYLFPGKTGYDQIAAGRYINELIKDWAITDLKWTGNNLTNTKKNIHVHGIAKQIGQVKFVGQQINNWINENQTDLELIDTAIVLSDEKLLLPLLHSLPGEFNGKEIMYNVSMGYPLKDTSLSRFILQWLNLLIKAEESHFFKFDTWQFISLLKNPIVTFTLDNEGMNSNYALIRDLTNKNQLSFNQKEISHKLKSSKSKGFIELGKILFINITNATDFVKAMIKFLQVLAETIQNKESQSNAILDSQINLTFALVKKLQSVAMNDPAEFSLKALKKIFVQLLSRSEISLKGEPLAGIQIMGMLETRNLDFKNIILVSANEGMLPKAVALESFIPFDIRHDNNLPLPKDQNDVVAYHFYRLLQRAENISILYNTDSDKFGSGEKSRFILQLENELANCSKSIDIQNYITNINLDKIPGKQTISIAKNKDVINRLAKIANNGLSASALNVYRNCPLKFYFREVLKLQLNQKIEPEIEFNVFGNAIHDTLEEIYKPFIGKKIDLKLLHTQLAKLDDLLTNSFRKVYTGGNVNTGKNHLIYEIAKKYIEHFIRTELRDDSNSNKSIVSLEERIEIRLNHKSLKVKLKGYIDRIEKCNAEGKTIIIDYKTGKVEPQELTLKDWESLTDKSKDKLFQLLFYAYLYDKKYDPDHTPELGIYSLRMQSQGLIQPNLPDEENQFETYLVHLIDEILDPSVSFEQTTNENICSYCDYKDICNK